VEIVGDMGLGEMTSIADQDSSQVMLVGVSGHFLVVS
jgi:hypothetical protein